MITLLLFQRHPAAGVVQGQRGVVDCRDVTRPSAIPIALYRYTVLFKNYIFENTFCRRNN